MPAQIRYDLGFGTERQVTRMGTPGCSVALLHAIGKSPSPRLPPSEITNFSLTKSHFDRILREVVSIGHFGVFTIFTILLAVAPGPARAEPLTLATADTEPFANDAGTGFYDLVVAEAFARAGHQVRTVRRPSDRSLADAVSGALDGEYARISGLEEQHPSLVRVPVPLGTFRFTAFVREGGPPVDSWDDLARLHVGFIDGWVILEENVTRYASLTRVADEALLFGLLVRERVDVVLYELRRGLRLIERGHLTGIRAQPRPLAERPMYLYLHRRNAGLVVAVAGALESMQTDGTVSRLQAQAFAPGVAE